MTSSIIEFDNDQNDALGDFSAVASWADGNFSKRPFAIIVENYVRYYASGDAHTSRAKRYDLNYFLEFLQKLFRVHVRLLRVSHWTYQSTVAFVDSRIESGESPATVSRRLATIKHFGRTLADRVPEFLNPAREVRGPSLTITKPKSLNPEDIELLRQAAKPSNSEHASFHELRNQMLLELLLGTGLRADEVRSLVLGQISEDGSWLKNVRTKGKKYRNIYIDSTLRPMLETYLHNREMKFLDAIPAYSLLSSKERASFPVFLSLRSAQLDSPVSFALAPKTVWRIISDTGQRARGLAETLNKSESVPRLHPHLLRHTFAHGLLDTSKDIRLVAQALGHSDVRTTMRYTERTEDELAKAIEKKRSQGR